MDRLRAPFLVEARLDTGLLLQSTELATEQAVEEAILELVGATMVVAVTAMDCDTGEVMVEVEKGPKSRLTWTFGVGRRARTLAPRRFVVEGVGRPALR